MNDDQLGAALRDALAAPEVSADRWAGQRLRRRVRDRRDARRGALAAVSVVVVAVLALGGVVGLLRSGGGSSDAAGGGGAGEGLAAVAAVPLPSPLVISEVRLRGGGLCGWARGVVDTGGAAECVPIGDPVVTIREVAGLRLVTQADGVPRGVQLDLLPEDLAALQEYGRHHAYTTVGYAVDGKVLGPLHGYRGTAGPLDLPAGPGKAAEDLYRRLGGT